MNLIQANKSHIKDIWFLRNDPLTRKASINSEEITWEEHNNWLKKNLNNKDMTIYIAELNNIIIGYIRFEKKFSETDTCSISISVDSKYHGLGYGSLLLRNGIIKFMRKTKNINKLIAVVKKNNLKSNKLFMKGNFIKESETDSEIKYSIKRSDNNYSI